MKRKREVVRNLIKSFKLRLPAQNARFFSLAKNKFSKIPFRKLSPSNLKKAGSTFLKLDRKKQLLLSARAVGAVAMLVLVVHFFPSAFTSLKAFAINGDTNQNGYIWENDDGSTADGNSQIAAGNTAVSVPKGSRINLRAQIKNTGSATDLSDLGLFYDNGDGVWNKVKSAQVKNTNIHKGVNTKYIVDGTSKGQYTSTAIDSSGVTWVSYYNASNTSLMVAKFVGTGGSGCSHSSWTCTTVDNTGTSTGQWTSIAIDQSGNPWVSYYDTTNTALKVAKYVSSGGTGCTSSAWTCTQVDNTGAMGQYTSIKIDLSGNPWVSYYQAATTSCNNSPTSECSVHVAQFVTSGGTGCTSSAWTCTIPDDPTTTNGYGLNSSIAMDSSGNPWISYDTTSGTFRVARYIGGGLGSGCSNNNWSCYSVVGGTDTAIEGGPTGSIWIAINAGGLIGAAKYVGGGLGTGCTDNNWSCYNIDDGESGSSLGQSPGIAFDQNGSPWIVSYDSGVSGNLGQTPRIAKYVGDGTGNCTYDNNWICASLDTDNIQVGLFTSIAISSTGSIWVSYYDQTGTSLRVMQVNNIGSSGCGQPSIFDCAILEANNSGQFTSVAIDSSGNPWVSYYDIVNTSLKIAKYIGSGGNCYNTAWNCITIDNSASVGQYTSVAIDSSGNPWVSYYISNTGLMVARYVGAGAGTGCTGGSSDWTCTTVESGTQIGVSTSIAIDASSNPWIAYFDGGNSTVKVAKYVGGGSGTGCTSSDWTCTNVDPVNLAFGTNVSIAIGATGNAWMSYYGNSLLRVAKYVGGGSGTGCTSSDWTCTTVVDNGDDGQNSSIAIDASGNPWVSSYNATSLDLKVSRYVGGGSGNGCMGGSSDWTCETVDSVGSVGSSTSIAFDPSNTAWVSYYDATNFRLKVATYVGSGLGTGCNSNWTCFDANSLTSGIGTYNSLAIDMEGKPWISSFITGNLSGITTINSYGEVLLANSQRAAGSTISESHTDMSSTTDSSNRDDADCAGGGSWNNGIVIWAGQPSSGTLPDGTGTAQCSEVMFTIDLSQATVGTTYRFKIATNDAISSGKNFWRGPVSIAGGATPSVTITDASQAFAKDNTYRLPNCADTSWGCDAVDSTNDVGAGNSMTFDQSGTPWVSFYDTTNANLRVAKYVGAGNGSGCNNSAWSCTDIDTSSNVGQYSSIAIDSSGNPWVSYYYGTGGDLRVAHFVGSSGSGCASSAWTCTNIETTNDVGKFTSIALDKGDNPWISYYDVTNGDLRFARFVGSSLGTGCASNNWTCLAVDSTNDVGNYDTNIAIGTDNGPWISYYDATNLNLRVAQFVGINGSGCADTRWVCTSVDSTNDVGMYSSIAVDASGAPWVSYLYTTGTDLRVAKYVSSGGTGCATAVWNCTDVLSTPTASTDSSIAIGPDNKPWVSSYSTSSDALWVSRFVTSGGSGCTSSAWTCTTVDNSTAAASRIIFDTAGAPWVSYYGGSSDLKVAKLHRSLSAPTASAVTTYNGVNGTKNSARYALTLGNKSGDSPGACSSGTSDYYGICGLFQNSGDYDTTTALTNESPYLTFATRYSSNSELPTAQWIGQTSLAPNTGGTVGDLTLQIYHYGSTNAWETIASDSSSSGCSSDNCTLQGIPSGTASEYFQTDSSGKYWLYYRLYQEASTSTGITLKTDQFSAFTTAQKLGTGTLFQDGVKRPLNQR